jgi:hypothetical protein
MKKPGNMGWGSDKKADAKKVDVGMDKVKKSPANKMKPEPKAPTWK